MSDENTPDFYPNQNYKIDFAIFSAMSAELEYFETSFSPLKCKVIKVNGFNFKIYRYNNKNILLAATGFGTTFAASVLTLIHNIFQPKFIFLSGTAGGINSALKLRDVVIAEQAFEAEIQPAFTLLKGTPFESCLMHPLNNESLPCFYPSNHELFEIAKNIEVPGIRIHKGTVVSSNLFPAPKDLFERIKKHNPYFIDMETSAFYQIAWLLKIPVVAVKGISNLLNSDGTDDRIVESDVKGSSETSAKVTLKIIDKIILKLDDLPTTPTLHYNHEVTNLINKLNLQPHPEGGLYVRTHQSISEVQSPNTSCYHSEIRYAVTLIYYLLYQNDFSAWHSLTSDEIWHFYQGSPVKIYVIDGQGILNTYFLGDPTIHEGASFQVVIAANCWFAAEIMDKSNFCLVGCSVSPGFDFKDFKLGDREFLTRKYPQHEEIINAFTRVSTYKAKDSSLLNN